MNVKFDQSYPSSLAEHGKFVPIDSASLETVGLPASATLGRYAVLTYNVGADTGSPGSSASNPIFVETLLTNNEIVCTANLQNNYVNIDFSFKNVIFVEVYNFDTTNYIYIKWGTSTNLATITATGMPLPAGGYYGVDKEVTSLTIGTNLTSTDLRVFGHYRG